MQSLLPLLVIAGCAVPSYDVQFSPKAVLPAVEPAVQGERWLAPDEVLFRAPVGHRLAAVLDTKASVTLSGVSHEFAAGRSLRVARVTGPKNFPLPTAAVTFCGGAMIDLAKALAEMYGTTTADSMMTEGPTTVCFLDAERDGFAEAIIPIMVEPKGVSAPVAITPVPYHLLADEPMAGGSEARLKYDGASGLTRKAVRFQLKVLEGGLPLLFDNDFREVKISELPQKVDLFSTSFWVREYDPATDRVRVEVLNGFQGMEYKVTTTTRTRTTPIYVPR